MQTTHSPVRSLVGHYARNFRNARKHYRTSRAHINKGARLLIAKHLVKLLVK